jgi:preprotein translocase subunit SecA
MLRNLFNQNSIANKYKNLVNQINALESNIKSLTDSELRAKTFELKKIYKEENDLNSILAESFAITREASLRTLGLRHFDVQILGGLTLNNGKIAEMRTGEGKTLVATLPAYLNGLTEKGVHIVTVNDYLAERDQVSMGQIYRFLGLDTGLIQENMTVSERQKNYDADITYVTNSELGFDYLRDNMALNLREVVL